MEICYDLLSRGSLGVLKFGSKRADHIAPFQKSHLDHDQQRPTTSSRDILTMDFWRKIMMPSPVSRKRDPSPPMTPEARLERYKRGWSAVQVLPAASSLRHCFLAPRHPP